MGRRGAGGEAVNMAAIGAALALIVSALVYHFSATSGLESEIERLTERLELCNEEKNGYEVAVASQNLATKIAKRQAEQMRERQAAARAEAERARTETNEAIAGLRREQAESQTCDEVRMKLITEATGHVYRF